MRLGRFECQVISQAEEHPDFYLNMAMRDGRFRFLIWPLKLMKYVKGKSVKSKFCGG